jgi:hypothetical protein
MNGSGTAGAACFCLRSSDCGAAGRSFLSLRPVHMKTTQAQYQNHTGNLSWSLAPVCTRRWPGRNTTAGAYSHPRDAGQSHSQARDSHKLHPPAYGFRSRFSSPHNDDVDTLQASPPRLSGSLFACLPSLQAHLGEHRAPKHQSLLEALSAGPLKHPHDAHFLESAP